MPGSAVSTRAANVAVAQWNRVRSHPGSTVHPRERGTARRTRPRRCLAAGDRRLRGTRQTDHGRRTHRRPHRLRRLLRRESDLVPRSFARCRRPGRHRGARVRPARSPRSAPIRRSSASAAGSAVPTISPSSIPAANASATSSRRTGWSASDPPTAPPASPSSASSSPPTTARSPASTCCARAGSPAIAPESAAYPSRVYRAPSSSIHRSSRAPSVTISSGSRKVLVSKEIP